MQAEDSGIELGKDSGGKQVEDGNREQAEDSSGKRQGRKKCQSIRLDALNCQQSSYCTSLKLFIILIGAFSQQFD